MNEPDVLVLMLRVDEGHRRVVRETLNELRVSHLTIDLDAPLRTQLPAEASPPEVLEDYLEVCRCVIFVVGDATTPRARGALTKPSLKRLVLQVDLRRLHGRSVFCGKLGDRLPQIPELENVLYENIYEGGLGHFIRMAVGGGSMPGAPIAPPKPPEGKGKRGNARRGAGAEDRSRDFFDEPYLQATPGGLITGGVPRGVPAANASDDERNEGARPAPDDLHCSVYSPRLASPGDEILVQAFAHLDSQASEVADMAAAADTDAEKVGTRPLSEPVAEGETVGLHLKMRGAEIDEPDQEFVWRREPLAAQFTVYFPEDSRPREAVGTVIVTKAGVPVGHVKFTLDVLTREQKEEARSIPSEHGEPYTRYGRAFVSYASKDREKVLPRVQALAAARIDVFQDFVELEPGERWERGLYKHIDECDVFFLFWSQAARDSEWVCKEAEYAHTRQAGKEDRPPEIIPIIIEGPPPVSPPPELNFLHFNDKYIYLLKGVEAEAEAKRKRQT